MTADDMIGVTLGNYRITSKLGQGGMGAVYLAEHDVLGRKAAIKILLPELSHQRESVRRFFHEARMTAQLRHPAMVDVFDYGTLPDGRAFLIMDYLEGECLEARIDRRGPLPVLEALITARQIAVGVSVAHAAQIVHRDLKPDNIFLLPPAAGSADERVKILDFGIAKLGSITDDERLTRAGTLIGTPLYMSPEQCRGDQDIDGRADIYSLGCILYTMLAGRPPFVSNAIAELVTLHIAAPVPKLSALGVAVPPAVEDLLTDLLGKSPDQRLPNMTAVAMRIAVLLKDAGVALAGSTEFLPRTEGATLRQRPDSSIRELRKRLTGSMASIPAVSNETVSSSSFDRMAANQRDTKRDTHKDAGKPPRKPGVGRPRSLGRVALAAGTAVLMGAIAVALLSRDRPGPPAAPIIHESLAPSDRPKPTAAEEPPAAQELGLPAAGPSTAPGADARREGHPGRAAGAIRDDRLSGRPEARPDAQKSRPVYRGSPLEIEKRMPY